MTQASQLTRLWSIKQETVHGVLWYRATCYLSDATFVPLFISRKAADDYKRARAFGSGWKVARLEAKEW